MVAFWHSPLRNRWFEDLPLEGTGFELMVPVRQAKLVGSSPRAAKFAVLPYDN
jgi:hypothetical protein